MNAPAWLGSGERGDLLERIGYPITMYLAYDLINRDDWEGWPES